MQRATLLSKLGFSDKDKENSKHDIVATFLGQPDIISLVYPQVFNCSPADEIKNISVETEVPLSKGQRQYKTTIGFIDGVIKFDVGIDVDIDDWNSVVGMKFRANLHDLSQLECLHGTKLESKKCTNWRTWSQKTNSDDDSNENYCCVFSDFHELLSVNESIETEWLIEKSISRSGESVDESDVQSEITDYNVAILTSGDSKCHLRFGDIPVKYLGGKVPTTKMRHWETETIYVESKITPVTTGDVLRQIKLYKEYIDDDYGKWVVAAPFSFNHPHLLEKANISYIQLYHRFNEFCAIDSSTKKLCSQLIL